MSQTQTVTEQKLTIGQKYDLRTLGFVRFVNASGNGVPSVGLYSCDWFRRGVYLGPDVDGVEPLFVVAE